MRIAGIICEYNPFHNGHAHQLAVLREAGYAPVCVMSGDYVQRGEPAVIPAAARAEAAVRCGAALVLELPPSYALRSAEGFADGGVELLDRLGCAEALCFGSESGDAETLLATAQTLLSPELVPLLKQELAGGASFPAARQRALERLGAPGAALLERAVLARLRAMGEDEFAALPYGSEGLWQKVMHACRTEASLEGILAAAKSKRYPRTRLMRMLLCAFLGLTEQQLTEPAPYVRVLALDADGRAILRAAQGGLPLLHAGERAQDCAFAETERRCRALYGLFRENGPAEPSPKMRVYVQRD